MDKTRLEAFSDGVIAIIITIMVLELKLPRNDSAAALFELGPIFLSYVLSFTYIAIYWNNHHHLLHAAQKVNGPILWANMFLLFTLSLTPFATAWMGQNHFSARPVALYGVVLLSAGIAYYILSRALIDYHGKESLIATAIGRDFKGIISVAIYAIAIALSFFYAWAACALYFFVAVMWLIPDRRIEQRLA